MSQKSDRVWLGTVLALSVNLPLGQSVYADAHHAHDVPNEVDMTEWYAPTTMPERIILTWSGDPATTQSVTWRTNTSVGKSFGEIALANADGWSLEPERFEATTERLKTKNNEAHYHSLTFENLSPDTLYVYRVGDGKNWSEYQHFRTASDRPAPFSFLYFGDAQNDVRMHWSRVFREAFKDAPRAAFALHAGDLVNVPSSDVEWGEWHDGPAWVNGTLPVLATPGNHEYEWVNRQPTVVTAHWRPGFAFPLQDPPKGLEETVYYIDYQGVRFISLDSNVDHAEQVPWFRKALENNPNRWTIVTFHHPVFSPVIERDNDTLRNAWKPLLDEFKVDLVLSGHDHTYARTGDLGDRPPLKNVPDGYQQAYDPSIGTVYVVSVSGPKMYPIEENRFAKRIAERTQLYQVIDVNDAEIRFRAFTATGELYDAFTIEKRAGQPNRLREVLPDERRAAK
ncbi:MAG: metallophosphoesterase family protein [Pseudomonadota bacterium]